MHGLWPNNCNECPQWFPQHCSEENFDITAIPDDTHSRMKQIWKSAPQFGCKYPLFCTYASRRPHVLSSGGAWWEFAERFAQLLKSVGGRDSYQH